MSAIALDPLIAEAKERAKRRRLLALAAAGLLAVGLLAFELSSVGTGGGAGRGGPPRLGPLSGGARGGDAWRPPVATDDPEHRPGNPAARAGLHGGAAAGDHVPGGIVRRHGHRPDQPREPELEGVLAHR